MATCTGKHPSAVPISAKVWYFAQGNFRAIAIADGRLCPVIPRRKKPLGGPIHSINPVLFPTLDFVLRIAGPQRLGEHAEELIFSQTRYLDVVPDIGGFGAIEVEVGFAGVGVNFIATLQHSERHQRVEKVAHAARMKPAALLNL
jgi:hypothetical protein